MSDEEIIAVFENHNAPVLSTREIAERLPIKKRGTEDRLKKLKDSGKIEGRKASGLWIWWLSGSL